MTEAKIHLRHNQFQIAGPPELINWINALHRTAATAEVMHAVYMKHIAEYYVHCFVTGDRVALSELKYWNVELQEAYKDAATGLVRYTELTTLP